MGQAAASGLPTSKINKFQNETKRSDELAGTAVAGTAVEKVRKDLEMFATLRVALSHGRAFIHDHGPGNTHNRGPTSAHQRVSRVHFCKSDGHIKELQVKT
jgi:hypothetical protein